MESAWEWLLEFVLSCVKFPSLSKNKEKFVHFVLVFLFYHAYWSGNGTQTTVLHTYFLAESVPSIKSLGESWAFKGNFEKLESLRTKCADKLFVVLTHFLSADSSYGLPYAKFQFFIVSGKGYDSTGSPWTKPSIFRVH